MMAGRDVIKAIMSAQGVSVADIAARLNVTMQTAWERLNGKRASDLRVSNLADMARLLGYKVVVVPRDTKIPADSYEVN